MRATISTAKQAKFDADKVSAICAAVRARHEAEAQADLEEQDQ